MTDPTPAAAEARATKATQRDARDFAVEFGGYLADAATDFLDRYVAVPRASTAEDFQHLRSAIYEFRKRADRIPEAKDGAAPSLPETPERGVANGGPSGPSEGVRTEPSVPRSGTAAPSPETGWRETVCGIINRRAAEWRASGDSIRAREAEDISGLVADLPAAPAAPSPDLAALEELARRVHVYFTYEEAHRYDAAIRTAILHLKAQPNAGPSADGGKDAKA